MCTKKQPDKSLRPRYAMEIDRFQETSQISLDDLRKNVLGFVAPQMYIYLDGTELMGI